MPDPSTSPLPPLPAAGAGLLAHLLGALVEGLPGAIGAVLALLPGDLPGNGAAAGVHVLAVVGAAVGAAAGEARLANQLTDRLAEAGRAGRPVLADAPGDGEGRGLVAVPSPPRAEGEEPLAVALVLDRPPVPADADTVAAALPGLVLAVAVLRGWAAEAQRAEQMVQMVQYRRVIEQAKGLVMAVTGSDAGAAFATLARASQHFNVRLRNLAVALVELVGGSPAEGPEDPVAVIVPGERDRTAAANMWAALGSGGVAGTGKGEA